jgi:hypothetical protein
MTLVVDRMREMLQENERLHATIADLHARQEHTENRLALLENAGSGVVQTAAGPRHRPIAPELGLEHNSELGEFLVQTPTFFRGYDLASLIIINDQRCATPPRPGAPSTRAHSTLRRVCACMCGRKPWLLLSLNEPRTLAEVESPIAVYLSPAMRYLLGYDVVRCSFTYMQSGSFHGLIHSVCSCGSMSSSVLRTTFSASRTQTR